MILRTLALSRSAREVLRVGLHLCRLGDESAASSFRSLSYSIAAFCCTLSDCPCSKDALYMQAHVAQSLEPLLTELIAGYHVLDHDGQASGVAGHLSARLPGAQTFWSHRFGLTFGEVGAAQLLESDFELNVLRGTPPINPTMHIHTRIYLARPDVNAIVHTHGKNILALSAIGAELEMCTQPAALFHQDIAYLDEYEGAALGKSEGDAIAHALGKKTAVVLRHHGQLVVGASVGDAVFRAVRLESVAGLQLAAMAAGRLQTMPLAGTEQVQRFQTAGVAHMQWLALRREIFRLRPNLLDGLHALVPPPGIEPGSSA